MVRRFSFVSLLLIVVLAAGLVMMPSPQNIVFAAGGNWILPTGHSDPNSTWSDEALAYDDDTSTYAMSSYLVYPGWGDVLVFTHASFSCSKIRFNAGHYAGGTDSIDVDVYYSSAWHNVYEGDFEGEAWIEADLGGVYAVTQARVRMQHTTSPFAKFYEFGFYSIGAASIITNPASDISFTTARLNSYLVDDGGEACDVRFQYNTSTGTPYAHNTTWVNDTYYTGNSPYVDIAGLTGDTIYYFRVQVRNTNGIVSGSEYLFTTLLAVGTPSNLVAYPSSDSVSLSWTKGSGSSRTKIMYAAGSYPTSHENGTQAYFGTQSTVACLNLTSGVTYYFRAWGEDAGNWSASYADAIATTTAGVDAGDLPSAPSLPSRWFGAPDYTSMANLPFYSIINDVADDYNVPRNSFWFVLTLIAITALGLFVYSVSHNPTIAVLVTIVGFVIGARQD